MRVFERIFGLVSRFVSGFRINKMVLNPSPVSKGHPKGRETESRLRTYQIMSDFPYSS